MSRSIKLVAMLLMVGLLLVTAAAPASADSVELQACWSNSCPPELNES
jgi:ABC-type nitrate/sulfonate/bicarbonate transport system substrate-binding protein